MKTHIKLLLFALFSSILITPSNVNAQIIDGLKRKLQKESEKAADKIGDELLNPKKENDDSDEENSEKSESEKDKGKFTIEISERLNFKSPNQYYKSFEIQQHKEFPRFGEMNEYRDKVKNYDYSQEERQQYRDLIKKDKDGLKAYFSLMIMNTNGEYYEKIDREYLTADGYLSGREEFTEDEIFSILAQRNLKSTLRDVGSVKLHQSYFCNSETGDCSKPETYGMQTSGVATSNWGGKGANDFKSQEAYNAYSSENYESLLEWSKDFWEKSEKEAYYVTTNMFRNYDFKKEGYEIRVGRNLNGITLDANKKIKFKKEEGVEQYNNYFISIPKDKAEEYVNKHVYLVYKIKLSCSEIYKPKRINTHFLWGVNFFFELSSSSVEIYSDEELTNKVAEFDLDE